MKEADKTKVKKDKRLVSGKGFNDVKGPFFWEQDGIKFYCPYYRRWASMLDRCYSDKVHKRNPTYIECYVCDAWLLFSTFKAWMQTQDWEGKALDKDLLVPGNKVYSPETCVFITPTLNAFIVEKGLNKSKYLLGAYIRPDGRFSSTVMGLDGKLKYIGNYATEEEAHLAWAKEKWQLAIKFSSEQKDPRIVEALISRYKNYADKAADENILKNAKIAGVEKDIKSIINKVEGNESLTLLMSDLNSALSKIQKLSQVKEKGCD
jgi:hypothetical protein